MYECLLQEREKCNTYRTPYMLDLMLYIRNWMLHTKIECNTECNTECNSPQSVFTRIRNKQTIYISVKTRSPYIVI